jgi:hypothetical protein
MELQHASLKLLGVLELENHRGNSECVYTIVNQTWDPDRSAKSHSLYQTLHFFATKLSPNTIENHQKPT